MPSLVLFSGADLPYGFIFVTVAGYVMMALVAKVAKLPRIAVRSVSNVFILKMLMLATVMVVLMIVVLGGGKYINFDITAVYDVREDAASNLPGVFGYINPVLTKIVIPLGIVLSLLGRRWAYAITFFGCGVVMFALTAHKSVLLYPFVAFFFYFLAENKRRVEILLFILLVIVGVSLAELYVFSGKMHEYWFSSVMFRRAMLVPSYLNWIYYDWFSVNPAYYWADSKITLGLIESPYNVTSPRLMGSIYFGKDLMSANVGWIGSGMANAGFSGVMVYSILVGMLLSLLDSYAIKLGGKTIA